jgi:hypothetical protein
MNANQGTITNLYLQIAKDSGFQLNEYAITNIVAKALNIHPLQVWGSFAGLDVMRQIARGEHPACKK